jgi:hypothetical protein
MPSGLSSFAAVGWLPILFGRGIAPGNYYVGLVTAAPPATYSGTDVMALEPQGGGYVRQAVGLGSGWWDLVDGGVANHNTIAFPTPTADWGRMTHAILCSAAGAGDLYAWGELRPPQSVLQAVPASFAPGGLIFTMPSG